VTEVFFKRERGEKMGVWTLMVTLGSVLLYPLATKKYLKMMADHQQGLS